VPRPLRLDAFWDSDERTQASCFDCFDDQWGILVRKVAYFEMYNVWMQSELREHLLSLLPRGITGADFGRIFGCDRARLGTYQQGTSDPGGDLTHAWLRRFKSSYPPIKYDRVFDAVGVAAAVERVVWQKDTATMLEERVRRRDLRETSVEDAVLSYALKAPGPINKSWIVWARNHQHDLLAAIDRESFHIFIDQLLGYISQLFGKSDSVPHFKAAANRLADVALDSPTDILRFVERIADVWNAEQLSTHLAARCLAAEL
jgi:hypothetical protein